MKKILSIILSILLLASCLVIPMFNVTADTLDAYNGDSWNTVYRSPFHKIYTRTMTWSDGTTGGSTSQASGYTYFYKTAVAGTDLIGSDLAFKGVSMPKGTYEYSFAVASNMAKVRLEMYDANGNLINKSESMDSNRKAIGTVTFEQDTTGMTWKAVVESSSTSGTFRVGIGRIKFVSVGTPEWTSRTFDANRSYAGASATATGGPTSTATLATVAHENCTCDDKHTMHGVKQLSVDDYVYYKFTDIPAGTYDITDNYYDVSGGKAKWDVYVGNSVETLTRVNGLTSYGSNAVKTLKTENVTVDATGILIYAIRFTESGNTADSCRTVHGCFEFEQTSATGEPLETESTVVPEETTTTTTTTTTTVSGSEYFTPADVANNDNWLVGWWQNSNGAYNATYGNNSRAALAKKVEVTEGETYKFAITGTDASGLNIVLRTYDASGSFKGTGTLTSWKYKIPSGVKYVSLTMYDKTNLIDYIKAGTVSASMVVDGAVEPSSSSTTTTTTQKEEESSSVVVPEDATVYNRQSEWVDGQKYLMIAPSATNEGYSGKGILLTNTLKNSTYTGTETINSLKLTDYDNKSVNSTSKGFNALESFATTQDLSQYYLTAEAHVVDGVTYFAFKNTDGKYIAAGKQEGKNVNDWNRTYFSDTINDDTLFTGTYREGKTGEYAGNGGFKVTAKSGYFFRVLNAGDIICKADGDNYQVFFAFYTVDGAEIAPTVDLSMKTGAALRLGTENGLRFYTQVDAEKLSALQDAGYTVEMGTLITPVDILGSEELTLESSVAKLDVKYSAFDSQGNIIYYENGNTFVGSIVKIKESATSWSETSGNLTREYVGRGYVKLTKDGETTVVYADYSEGNIANNTRSLQYVAQAYRNDSTSNYYILDFDFQLLVDKWAEVKK